MSEDNLLLYQVNVNVQVSDENNGFVYAFLLQSNVEPSTIQNDASNHISNLTPLDNGFVGDTQIHQVSGTLTYTFNSISELTANIRSVIEPGIIYYLYIYAVDAYNNSILVKQTESIILSTDSTSIHISVLYPLESPTGTFHEFRNTVDVYQPTVTSSADINYFGFFENRPDYENVLFANIFADPGEFIIDELYSFAIENPPLSTEGNETKLMNLLTNTSPSHLFPDGIDYELLFQKTKTFPYKINTFYANIESNIQYDMLFNKNYTIFHAFHLKGIDKYIIQRSDTITTGSPPIIQTSNAKMDDIEKDFIISTVVEENVSGSFKVITTIDRSILHDNQSLYLYTASFGNPQYDHQSLLANIDTHFTIYDTLTSNTTEHIYTTVQDANYNNIDASLVNGIFVYQFASVGRNASDIQLGAPSSNLTDFNGSTLYRNNFPLVSSNSSNARLFHYNDDFTYYIFKIRKDSLNNITDYHLQSLVRNIHQYIHLFDADIIIQGYVEKGILTNNIDTTSLQKAFSNPYDYVDMFLLSTQPTIQTNTYIATLTTDLKIHVNNIII
tara:strand:+ start:4582 stop:6255 length:1674 start_codon:yes stop_codon:yes gene_type:complete